MHLSLDFSLLGIVSFGICLGFQILLWRTLAPTKQLLRLVEIFFFLPLTLALGLVALSPDIGPALIAPGLLHTVFAANYLAIYPAFQATSPTVEILTQLDRKPEGLSRAELAGLLGRALVLDRLSDLERSGLLIKTNGELVPSRWGRLLARFFISYRRFVGLPEGVG